MSAKQGKRLYLSPPQLRELSIAYQYLWSKLGWPHTGPVIPEESKCTCLSWSVGSLPASPLPPHQQPMPATCCQPPAPLSIDSTWTTACWHLWAPGQRLGIPQLEGSATLFNKQPVIYWASAFIRSNGLQVFWQTRGPLFSRESRHFFIHLLCFEKRSYSYSKSHFLFWVGYLLSVAWTLNSHIWI